MAKTASSFEDVLSAVPAVRKAVKKDIAGRIAAGEAIASMSDAEMRERSKAVLEHALSRRVQKKSAA